MRKIDSYYAISGYRYAPEMCKAYRVTGFSNGNRNVPCYERIPLSSEETSKCGNALVCKGRQAAIAELKRIMRKRDREKVFITYGFKMVDDPRRYVYVKDRYCFRDDLSSRLSLYKAIKQCMEDKNWEHVTYTKCELDGAYNIENKQDCAEKITSQTLLTIL